MFFILLSCFYSGTGHDRAKDENRAFLDSVELTPQFMRGRVDPDLTTKLGKKTFKAPFGAAPIGLSSLIAFPWHVSRRNGANGITGTTTGWGCELVRL